MEIIGGAFQSDFEYDDLAGAISPRPPAPKHLFSEKKIQYNQAKHDPSGCTRYGAMTCIANNRGIEWTDDDFLWFRNNAPRYGWINHQGMYTSKAGDMVVERLNYLYPSENWIKESIYTYGNENLSVLLEKGWMLHFGSVVNSDYANQIRTGIIKSPRGKKGAGHARSLNHSGYKMIVENYIGGLPYNIIDIQNIQELIDVKQFHTQVFIYYPTTMKTEIPYPYMTVTEADAIEKKYTGLVSTGLSESVRAWIDASEQGKFQMSNDKNIIRWKFKNYTGIDGVAKMMIDLEQLR